MRQASEFQTQVVNRGLTRWEIYQCSICGAMCGYVFAASRVYYDSSCDCVPGGSMPQPRTWQEVADFYNSRRDPEGIARMDAFWGFDQPSPLTARQSVYAAIDGERAYQDLKWGTIETNPHGLIEWRNIAYRYLGHPDSVLRGDGRDQFRMTAAVLIAALEQYGCPARLGTERVRLDPGLVSPWIPVATRLPSRSGHYPIIHSHGSASGYITRKQWYARYSLDDGLWHDLQDDTDVRWSKVVTHWFDLPKMQEIDATALQPRQDEVAHAYNL
jgi:hypothetical protein